MLRPKGVEHPVATFAQQRALHPAAVDEFLSAKIAAGRVLGPIPDNAVEAL